MGKGYKQESTHIHCARYNLKLLRIAHLPSIYPCTPMSQSSAVSSSSSYDTTPCVFFRFCFSRKQLGMFKEVVGRACKRAVSELMLEFDTGGNVRFEEGRPGDVWFSSCADLVKSRVVRYRSLVLYGIVVTTDADRTFFFFCDTYYRCGVLVRRRRGLS